MNSEYETLKINYEKLQSEVSRLKTELANRDYERNMETSALQAEVEQLKLDAVEHVRLLKVAEVCKTNEIYVRNELQSEVELWRDKHKIVSDGFEKLDEHAQELAAKLQAVEQVLDLAVKQREAAEAEIDRQISLRKASESVDEEYRAKLEAAEAIAQGMNIAGKQAYEDARRLAEALRGISIFTGYDPYHVGATDYDAPEIKMLTEIVESMRDEACEALTPEIRKKYLRFYLVQSI